MLGADSLDHADESKGEIIPTFGADGLTSNQRERNRRNTHFGPLFFNPDAAVGLTENVDVVFFRGGYAEIKGFELGKILSGFSCLKMS